MTGEALFIVPTVPGRAKRLAVFLDAFAITAADAHLLVAHDDMLPADPYEGHHITHVAAARRPLGRKVNYWARRYASGYDMIGFLADDCVPESLYWDDWLAAPLRAAPGITYPRSNRRNDIPEHWLISSVIVRALGWMFLPGLGHYYADEAWHDLGSEAGCLHLVNEAVVRHDHYDVAPVQHDAVYFNAEREHGGPDGTVYREWRDGPGFARDLATVKGAIAGD